MMDPYSFTPIADLVVELTDVKEEQHLFLVSSANLRVASPVWRKTLDLDSKFGSLRTISVAGKEYRKITIKEVEAEAVRILFRILHYDTRNVPKSFSDSGAAPAPTDNFSVLRSIALLVDEYDCVNVVAPWVRDWIGTGTKEPALDPEYTRVGCEDWIFVASVFAELELSLCNRIIEIVSEELIRTLVVYTETVDEESVTKFYRWKYSKYQKLIAQNNIPSEFKARKRRLNRWFDLVEVKLDIAPQKILDYILDHRSKTSHEIILPLYNFVQELVTYNTFRNGTFYRGKQLCKNDDCIAIATGSLIRCLKKEGFNNFLTADLDISERLPRGRISIAELYSKVSGIQMTTFQLERMHETLSPEETDAWIKSGVLSSSSFSDTSSSTTDSSSILLRTDGGSINDPSKAVCPMAVQFAAIKKETRDVLDSVAGCIYRGDPSPKLLLGLGDLKS